ncbi:hypothetical protein [Marinobacter segnicrescens]|uniref:N-acetyltransferase domain-containing protein n=1 Tax=Marinobacter segnicrescens TaxID=430453 RepID=A0A1I0GUI6_9GAMM|nr:hypothetical protein [Marinobacter segnicrescens]SET74080.1 hypothetical protein SAMN04487962_12032 [Marinobacter segnicrescens]
MTVPTPHDRCFQPLPVSGFPVPAQWRGTHALLVSAGREWVTLDYPAVVESRNKLKNLFGPRDQWPPDDLTPEMDEADLAWHAREFSSRRSFAYHLLSHDQQQCLGCLYLYPTASRTHDAEAYLWTHIELTSPQATLIEDEVIGWVSQDWPFTSVAWPGRFIPFKQWEESGIPNYYASTRMAGESPDNGS